MRHKTLFLTTISLAFFMVIMDATIVNVALPTMAKNLQGDITWLQWVVNAYTLTFACLLLSAGDIADRLGAKHAFILGLVLFVITSAGCGLATHFLTLVLIRLMQGISAALVIPTSIALLKMAYENPQERAQALGTRASIGGIAAVTGPLIGAVLTTVFNWRAIFFVNIPFGVIAILLAIYFVPNFKDEKLVAHHFDWNGQLLSIISIAALSFGLIEAGRLGWDAQWVIISFIVFFIALLLFLYFEWRHILPMLPLMIFKSKLFSTSVFISLILTFGAYGQLFVLTFYFQQIRQYSVLATGFAFIPMVGFNAIASYFSGKMMSKRGIRLPIIIGLVTGILGFCGLLITQENAPYYAWLFMPLAFIGFSIAYAAPAAAYGTIHAAPKGRAGIASGVYNMSRQLGILLSVSIFGTILNRATNFMTGMHATLIAAAIVYLSALILTFLYIPKKLD